MKKVLIVDDEPHTRMDISEILEGSNYQTLEVASGEEAFSILEKNSIDIVLLDFHLGDGINGLETLAKIKKIDNDIEVVMVTSEGDSEVINRCVELGVHTYLKKPYKEDDILIATQISAKLRDRNLEYRAKDKMLWQDDDSREYILGSSTMMVKIKDSIKRVGKHHDTTILITGESGTGKEMVARAIHAEFGDKNRPFIAVNCGAISPSLIESELFGHEKGSFTGAHQRKIGCFELANNGDIFLDEIAEIPVDCQAKLLRILQEKEFTRVGGTQKINSNFRLISATNRNLCELIDQSKFRVDLYYRINVYNIYLPALREKREDIPELIDGLLKNISMRLNLKIKDCSSEVRDFLYRQDWKGNVRALKNVLEIMAINSKDSILSMDDLPDRGTGYQKGINTPEALVPYFYSKCVQNGYQSTIQSFEKEIISHALLKSRTLTNAANKLGISKSTLSEKAKKYDIDFKTSF